METLIWMLEWSVSPYATMFIAFFMLLCAAVLAKEIS